MRNLFVLAIALVGLTTASALGAPFPAAVHIDAAQPLLTQVDWYNNHHHWHHRHWEHGHWRYWD